MKKILILFLILSIVMAAFVGCDSILGKGDPDDEPSKDNGGNTNEGDGNEPILIKLQTPIVTISDSGVASWNKIYGSAGYKVIINGAQSIITATSVQLNDKDTVTVCAIGDGKSSKDSDFSELQVYNSPAPTEKTSIADMASAPLDKTYLVEGIVCAAGKANLMLTDNEGNYLYVYTEQPHGFDVGDEVRFTGTKAAYWNVYELKDITSSVLISSGNEVETPFVKNGDADYFEGAMDDFTIGELVTVTGHLTISGNYYNFEVDGFEDALLSLAYDGTLEDGKDYTATGYLAFISGSTAKYINIIVIDIKEVNNDNPPEICEICGVSVLIGDHTELPCGHYACEGGEHRIYDCGHYICDGRSHVILGCGHFECDEGEHGNCQHCDGYLCLGDHSSCGAPVIEYCEACGGSLYDGDHMELPCGHRACESGEHGMYPCGHYPCDGLDHTMLDCGHFTCQGVDHTLLDCGHYSCQGWDHSICQYCGDYACIGDHSSCEAPPVELCEACNMPLEVGNHEPLECGHRACEDGEHVLCERCESYRCLGDHTECDMPSEYCEICGGSIYIGDHYPLDCGHCASLEGEHSYCERCGEYLCNGLDHTLLDCGHLVCEGGEHYDLPCGHYACEDGDHSSCIYCGDYFCDGEDHSLLDCGHFACQDGNHVSLGCGHYECEGGDHTLYDCGHCASTPGGHGKCDVCGKNLCTGNHSSCGEPVINYCNICGKNFEIGEHGMLGCGHYACEDGDHNQCPFCPGYMCTGDHRYRECGHPVCAYENLNHEICPSCGNYSCFDNHDKLDCGHNACLGGEHRECMRCLGYLCRGDHSALECGHLACEVGEHKLCSACSGYLCFGNHEPLDCGHLSCESCEGMLCPYCGEYLCGGKDHSPLGCGHTACMDGEHTNCAYCGGYLCTGDHLSCGKPTVEYCKSCGKDVSIGDHSLLDCGHFVCDGIDHSLCEICEEPLCVGEHGDGVCMKLSTFPEVIEGEYGEVHIVEGIICAVSIDEILITDNEGNYLYVYTEQPHGYTVGDGVRVTGHLETYGNLTYELVTTDIVCTSGGNDIVLPRLNSADSSYFLDVANSGYKMGEYITFEGYLDSSTNLFVVGDIYVGVSWTDIEIYYGETYQVVAYTLFISENSAWVIATDFRGEGDSLICPICGFYKFEGDHSMYICGHFACEGGDHAPLPCGHFECDEGDHYVLACGHYSCVEGDHGKLDCGHFECDKGEHNISGCGHYVCLYGKHYLLDCGHWSCEGGTHSHCGYCGGYLCIGDHSECDEEDEEIYCEICGGILTEGDHYLLVCGHFACEDGDHTECTRCGEYYCEGGDHYQLPCGHLFCEEGKHNIADCKMHYVCRGGDHFQLSCGHFVCQDGSHTKCGYCGGYLCIGTHDHEEYCSYCGGSIEYGDHSALDCGHHACQDGNHEQCSFCGGYFCQGGIHSICYGCRSAVCDGNEHDMCPTCGWYLCRGDHSILECGHKACDGGSHYPCDVCGEYLCLGGNHALLDCGHYICDGGIHKSCTACGEYTCNAPDHMLCTLCNEPACVGIHKTCPGCGEVTCNRADHSMCTVCGNRLCVGDHTECAVEGYFCDFNYSIHVKFSVDNYFLENDEISRPLIRLISNGYNFEQSLTLKFVPSDGGRFVLTAGYDFLGLAWIDEYTFSGTFENVGLLYRINITEASRYNASTGETKDMMQLKGTYFPFTTQDYIMVNDEARTFEIDKYGLLYFIFSEQYDLPPYGDICYFCNQEVTADNIPIHMYVCAVCGMHYCEGGVTEHLFYNDETWKSEHYPLTDEEKRWGVKLPGDVVINPIATADLLSKTTTFETSSSDEEEE